MGSLDSYLPIFVMILLGIAFATLSLVASGLLTTHRPTAAKEAPYECGIVPTHEPARRFPVRFYLVAMIFIVFDIEIIFLFPWAIVYGQLGTFGLVEILVFVATVFISFLYLIANGALDWGPMKRVRASTSQLMRTSSSTIRRVSPVLAANVIDAHAHAHGEGTQDAEAVPALAGAGTATESPAGGAASGSGAG
jgi:NADH-quinone oxidoreductase subunit A